MRTQFLIFNLFGDYVFPRDAAVWTSGLLEVMAELGVSERAVRSTLSRMKGQGWFQTRRDGRHSAYQLTPKGTSLLEEGSRRLFGPRQANWDGCWHLVIYSLPQELRSLRRHLRTRLSWMGYGMLLPGIMVAANSRREEVEALILELEVGEYVHFFTKSHLEMMDSHEIVTRCWDLPDINRRYARFIRRHKTDLDIWWHRHSMGDGLPPDESFSHRFWVTYEYSAFPREDPNLPDELLSSDWLGDAAAAVLAEYRDLLREPAEGFIESKLGIRPPAVTRNLAEERVYG